jgi:hypothetical protein
MVAPQQLRAHARDLVGLTALALVVAGIYGLAGWQWAAIATGFPVGGFYLWGEVRAAQAPPRPTYGDD